jgi:hypothetical protein
MMELGITGAPLDKSTQEVKAGIEKPLSSKGTGPKALEKAQHGKYYR